MLAAAQSLLARTCCCRLASGVARTRKLPLLDVAAARSGARRAYAYAFGQSLRETREELADRHGRHDHPAPRISDLVCLSIEYLPSQSDKRPPMAGFGEVVAIAALSQLGALLRWSLGVLLGAYPSTPGQERDKSLRATCLRANVEGCRCARGSVTSGRAVNDVM